MQPIVEQSPPVCSDIMIVDDNPTNLKLLAEMLETNGHEVRSFPLGRLALAAALKFPPDLFLLDVNMPEMDGYEVCDRLKAIEQLCDIPVIFLSAQDKTEDKVRAFQAGAADYISKPFRLEEVQARVKTHLNLHQLRRALKQQNEHLEQAVAARTQELANATERLMILDRSKNEFLNLISHEFRTPLNGLLGVGHLLLEDMPATPENDQLRGLFERSRRRILTILDDALLLTEIDVTKEQFKSGTVCLSEVLGHAVEATTEFALSRHVGVRSPATNRSFVLAEEDLLGKALQALLNTAVKFSVNGETVQLSQEDALDSCSLIIESIGRNIPETALPKFFDLLGITEAITPGGDLGLEPFLAYRILSLFGASVAVANRTPSGIRLTISLKNAGQKLEEAA